MSNYFDHLFTKLQLLLVELLIRPVSVSLYQFTVLELLQSRNILRIVGQVCRVCSNNVVHAVQRQVLEFPVFK